MIVSELILLLERVDRDLSVKFCNNDGRFEDITHVDVEMTTKDEVVITLGK